MVHLLCKSILFLIPLSAINQTTRIGNLDKHGNRHQKQRPFRSSAHPIPPPMPLRICLVMTLCRKACSEAVRCFAFSLINIGRRFAPSAPPRVAGVGGQVGEPTRSEGEGFSPGGLTFPPWGTLVMAVRYARVGWPWGDLAQHGRVVSAYQYISGARLYWLKKG